MKVFNISVFLLPLIFRFFLGLMEKVKYLKHR